MKITILTSMAAMLLLAPLPSHAQAVSASPQEDKSSATYHVLNLGTLGGTSSSGNAINDLGWVMGIDNLGGNSAGHATLGLTD